MKTEELVLIGVAVAAVWFIAKKPAPVVTTVQAPQVAPTPANSPVYGYPSNLMQTSPFATGGYQQRSDAQDAAAIITAISGVANTVNNIVSSYV